MVTHYTPQVAPGIIETRGGLCTDRYMKHLGNMIFRCVSISSTYPGQSITNWHFQISTLAVSLKSSLDPYGALVDHGISYIFGKLWQLSDFNFQSVFFKCFFLSVFFLFKGGFSSSKVFFSLQRWFFLLQKWFYKNYVFFSKILLQTCFSLKRVFFNVYF